VLQHRLADVVAVELVALAGVRREKAAPSGPNNGPFSSAGVSARVRAARLRGLSCRMAWTRSHVSRSMIASCSPG
jgi:hypothetical protein